MGISPTAAGALFPRIDGTRLHGLTQLAALPGLRGVRPLIEREHEAMGITVNVEDSELLREPIDRARAKGEARGKAEAKAEAIDVILRRRFSPDVPAGLIDHLAGFALPTLDVVFERSLAAGSVADALGVDMPAKTSETIPAKIAQVPENPRADALAIFLALSELRGVRPLVERLIEQEFTAKGITVDVADAELLREPIDRARTAGEARGKAEGKAEAIQRILLRRFPQDVPAGLVRHLSDLALPTLDLIFERSLAAHSVAAALGSHMPAEVPTPH